jgi:hypothetical protein
MTFARIKTIVNQAFSETCQVFTSHKTVKSSSPMPGRFWRAWARHARPPCAFIPYCSSGISPKSSWEGYATINIMKAIIHPPVHESYKRHRKQLVWQIILPMVLTAILFIASIVLIYFATFRGNGDVARWAAVATIWISIPIIIMSLVFLAILSGIVYLLIRLLQIAPIYTGKAQDFAYKVAGSARRAADAVVKPIIALNGIGASIETFLGRK